MRIRIVVLSVALLVSSGCISDAVKQNIAKGVAAHDRYTQLASMALNGELKNEEAENNISAEQVAATPRPVLVLLNRLLKSIWLSRGNWYAIQFNVLDGPDPASIPGLLDAPQLAIANEPDDLLDDPGHGH